MTPARRSLARLIAVICLILLPAGLLRAQPDDPPVTLWLGMPGEDGTVAADLIDEILGEILQQARAVDHIVGRPGIQQRVGRGGFPLPRCLQGLDLCDSPAAAVAQALGAERIVVLRAEDEGRVLHLDVRAPDQSDLPLRVEASSLRAGLLRAVSELTGARALLILRAQPVQGEAFINNVSVGETPLEVELPIGTYDVRVQAERFYPWGSQVELRAGDRWVVDAELSRRAASVTVRSGTPGARARFNDEAEDRPVNARYELDPGTHVLVVEAPGFAPERYVLDLLATDERDLSFVLQPSAEARMMRRRERILGWPLLLEGGLTGGRGRDRLQGVSGPIDGRDRNLDCPVRADSPGCDGASTLGHLQVHAGLLYHAGRQEWLLLGLQGGVTRQADGARAWQLDGSQELMQLEQAGALTIRAAQPGVWHLFRDRWEPFARGGLAVTRETWRGTTLPDTRTDLRLRRTALWVEAHAGVRWHLNPLVFAVGSLSGGVAFHGGTRWVTQLGMGMNLRSPLQPRPDRSVRFPGPPVPTAPPPSDDTAVEPADDPEEAP
jgi:hypothetical protein